MKIFSIIIILLFSNIILANKFEKNLILENCKSCHNLEGNHTKKIPSLNKITKDQFLLLMIKYKNEKSDGVMNRISKVLSKEDIKNLANIIYD